MFNVDLLRENELDRFEVTGLYGLGIRFDHEATRRLASCIARGRYQRGIIEGRAQVKTSGSYRGSCLSLLDRLRGEGLDVACVVHGGAVLYLVGEKNTIRMCKRLDLVTTLTA
jgi:hypothetical protein